MVEERQWCGGWSRGGCGEGSGGIMARVAEKKLVARGVGEEEAERVAKSVGRGGDSEGGREGGGNKGGSDGARWRRGMIVGC
jgi:hypothetical protein